MKRKQTFSLMLSLSLVQQCILPENWPFFRSRTNTQHNVLLMEMLYLGSMLIIIIVANLAWELVSHDLYHWLHSNSISCPETVVWNLFSLAHLAPKLCQNMCIEKGPNEAYADFLARLETAISCNVIKKEVKIQKKPTYLWKYKSGMSKSYHSNSWDWDYYWFFEGLSPFRIKKKTSKNTDVNYNNGYYLKNFLNY